MGGWPKTWAKDLMRPGGEKLDRGRGARGAKWQFVTPEGDLIDYAQQKALHNAEWAMFQKTAKTRGWILIRSKKEARRYVGLLALEREGHIRNLQRQIKFPLLVRNPEGLMAEIGVYVADHVYDERTAAGEWLPIVEDVKGNPEDLYLWKRKHWEAQHGRQLREV